MVTMLVFFKSENKATIPRSNGYLLLSAFSRILPSVFHSDTNLAPSISPLLPREFFNGVVTFHGLPQELRPPIGEIFVSRVGFLNDRDAEEFRFALQGQEICLNGAKFTVAEILEETKFCSYRSWDEIYQVTGASHELKFSFLTPTAFKRQDKLYLLPDPSVLFTSLLLKLQRIDGTIEEGETANLESNFENILISRCRISTDVMFLKGKMQNKGFVGEVTYDLSYCEGHVAKNATFLAEFARYSGVGIKTSQGMGSVWTETKM